MLKHAPNKSNAGFTLIELVLAISILGIILTLCYSSLSQIISSKRLLDDERDLDAITNAVIGRMVRELQLSASDIALLPPQDNIKNHYSAKVNLIGEHKDMPSGMPGDSITFLAAEGGQYLPDGGAHSGIVQIKYSLVKDPDKKDEKDEAYTFLREETPLIRPPEKAYEKTMRFPISENTLGVSFSYLNPEDGAWSDNWGNGNKVRLPKLVKFTFQFRSPMGMVRTVSTSVPLREPKQ